MLVTDTYRRSTPASVQRQISRCHATWLQGPETLGDDAHGHDRAQQDGDHEPAARLDQFKQVPDTFLMSGKTAAMLARIVHEREQTAGAR